MKEGIIWIVILLVLMWLAILIPIELTYWQMMGSGLTIVGFAMIRIIVFVSYGK